MIETSIAGFTTVPRTAAAQPLQVSVHPQALPEIEQLWVSLFFSTQRPVPRSLLVTSAEAGEGVTSTAAALALVGSSAAHGQRIALVDMDLRQNGLAGVFNLPPSPGVTDVLAGTAPLSSALHSMADERLWVLTAGQRENGLCVPKNDRLDSLVSQLNQGYDHVIFDAPPVNALPTAQALAGLVDGVLLVTRAGHTRREAVAEAKKRIEMASGRVVGVALNMRSFPIPGLLYRRM